MTASPVAVWLNTSFAAFDAAVAVYVHRLYELAPQFFTPFFEFISFLGKGGIFLIILSILLILFKKTRRYGTAMLLALAIGALFTNCFLKIVIARPRPYTDTSSIFYSLWQTVNMHVESDKSFPSGHTCAAFAAMTAVFFVGNKKYSWTAFIFAILMGVSRVYLVVHYFTDVLGGMVVGIIAGCIGYVISIRLPRVWYNWEVPHGKRLEPTE